MRKQAQGYKHPQSENGATMVEAAIVLPIFLAVLLLTFQVMIFCFHLLQFQYEVAEITRQAFVLSANERAGILGQYGNVSWQNFITTQINQRARDIGLATTNPANTAETRFITPGNKSCSGWQCSASATRGDVFSIDLPIRENILGQKIAGISWATVSVNVRAIGFVQRPQNEGVDLAS